MKKISVPSILSPKSSEDSNDASEEDDFFSSMAKRSSTKVTSELDCYLGMTSEEDISTFNSLPKLKKLFIKLNTPLPASAACERLFSTAGLIFSPKRANIGSSSFENQLLLKLNAKLIQLQDFRAFLNNRLGYKSTSGKKHLNLPPKFWATMKFFTVYC